MHRNPRRRTGAELLSDALIELHKQRAQIKHHVAISEYNSLLDKVRREFTIVFTDPEDQSKIHNAIAAYNKDNDAAKLTATLEITFAPQFESLKRQQSNGCDVHVAFAKQRPEKELAFQDWEALSKGYYGNKNLQTRDFGLFQRAFQAVAQCGQITQSKPTIVSNSGEAVNTTPNEAFLTTVIPSPVKSQNSGAAVINPSTVVATAPSPVVATAPSTVVATAPSTVVATAPSTVVSPVVATAPSPVATNAPLTLDDIKQLLDANREAIKNEIETDMQNKNAAIDASAASLVQQFATLQQELKHEVQQEIVQAKSTLQLPTSSAVSILPGTTTPTTSSPVASLLSPITDLASAKHQVEEAHNVLLALQSAAQQSKAEAEKATTAVSAAKQAARQERVKLEAVLQSVDAELKQAEMERNEAERQQQHEQGLFDQFKVQVAAAEADIATAKEAQQRNFDLISSSLICNERLKRELLAAQAGFNDANIAKAQIAPDIETQVDQLLQEGTSLQSRFDSAATQADKDMIQPNIDANKAALLDKQQQLDQWKALNTVIESYSIKELNQVKCEQDHDRATTAITSFINDTVAKEQTLQALEAQRAMKLSPLTQKKDEVRQKERVVSDAKLKQLKAQTDLAAHNTESNERQLLAEASKSAAVFEFAMKQQLITKATQEEAAATVTLQRLELEKAEADQRAAELLAAEQAEIAVKAAEKAEKEKKERYAKRISEVGIVEPQLYIVESAQCEKTNLHSQFKAFIDDETITSNIFNPANTPFIDLVRFITSCTNPKENQPVITRLVKTNNANVERKLENLTKEITDMVSIIGDLKKDYKTLLQPALDLYPTIRALEENKIPLANIMKFIATKIGDKKEPYKDASYFKTNVQSIALKIRGMLQLENIDVPDRLNVIIQTIQDGSFKDTDYEEYLSAIEAIYNDLKQQVEGLDQQISNPVERIKEFFRTTKLARESIEQKLVQPRQRICELFNEKLNLTKSKPGDQSAFMPALTVSQQTSVKIDLKKYNDYAFKIDEAFVSIAEWWE